VLCIRIRSDRYKFARSGSRYSTGPADPDPESDPDLFHLYVKLNNTILFFQKISIYYPKYRNLCQPYDDDDVK
jgi:hypothetical protein